MDLQTAIAMAKGVATYIPLLNRLSGRHTGGTVSPRYCYSVWLRHLTLAHSGGLPTLPTVVAELGPGDSLGTGLAALLCGAERLYAFDVVAYADLRRNLAILDGLVELFRAREPIPGDREFPEVKPKLISYEFPRHLLPESRLVSTLETARVEAIRRALRSPPGATDSRIEIKYFVPWTSAQLIEPGTVDFVYSQAVLEHVTNLDETYDALWRWLKPGGFMSHQIDFRSHGLAREWNGHWGHSDRVWRVIKGRKPYLLNREAHATHLAKLQEHGFTVVLDQAVASEGGIPRARLTSRFRHYTDDDLRTSGALLQSRKPST